MFSLFSKKWNPDGMHIYITGGTSGLGLSLAHILARQGADISIVARNQEKLNSTLQSLEKLRVKDGQVFKVYSHSLHSASSSIEALEAVCLGHSGKCPDAVFACAGSSKPKFFVEMTAQDLSDGMTDAYWVQTWTAWAAAKRMVKERKKGGKIVLVSSTLGYMSFVGWASYAPAKHALRGLADTLHSEFLLYDIDVHTYFANTMYTPGYEEENKTKPTITKDIEGTDEGVTPEKAAQILYKGVVNGEVHITGDLITSLFSASTRGSSPRNNWLLEGLYDWVAYFAVPVWRSSVEKQVVAHRAEHDHYLNDNGFFS